MVEPEYLARYSSHIGNLEEKQFVEHYFIGMWSMGESYWITKCNYIL